MNKQIISSDNDFVYSDLFNNSKKLEKTLKKNT